MSYGLGQLVSLEILNLARQPRPLHRAGKRVIAERGLASTFLILAPQVCYALELQPGREAHTVHVVPRTFLSHLVGRSDGTEPRSTDGSQGIGASIHFAEGRWSLCVEEFRRVPALAVDRQAEGKPEPLDLQAQPRVSAVRCQSRTGRETASPGPGLGGRPPGFHTLGLGANADVPARTGPQRRCRCPSGSGR